MTTSKANPGVEEPKVTQAEWLADAQDATAREHDMKLRDALRLYPKAALWSLAMSSTIIMEGYDTMLMGNFFAQPAFQRRYGVHVEGDSYEIPSRWQAGLNNGSACGQLIGLLLAGYISERFGFRKTMMGGLSLIVALIFIPFFAPSLEVLLVGQVLFGEFHVFIFSMSFTLMSTIRYSAWIVPDHPDHLCVGNIACLFETVPHKLHQLLLGKIVSFR